MIGDLLKYLSLGIFVILLQGLVLNNVFIFGGYGTPLVYVIFVLVLPFDMPKWLLYLASFSLGLAIDSFTNTGGMHASACVTLAFSRIKLIKLLTPRDGYETGSSPSVANLGLSWWIIYSGILIFIHHFWLFAIEIFRITALSQIFFRMIASSIFTFTILLVTQYLRSRKNR
jgi:hypothetical protein